MLKVQAPTLRFDALQDLTSLPHISISITITTTTGIGRCSFKPQTKTPRGILAGTYYFLPPVLGEPWRRSHRIPGLVLV